MWQFVKTFAYASFANLLLPIIRGLLLGMTWPVTKIIVYLLSQNVGTYQILIKKHMQKINKQEKKKPVEGISILSTNLLH